MKHLVTQPNFGTPGVRHRQAYTPGDDFYELLIDGHRGLTDAQSEQMTARLGLLLVTAALWGPGLRVCGAGGLSFRQKVAGRTPQVLSGTLGGTGHSIQSPGRGPRSIPRARPGRSTLS